MIYLKICNVILGLDKNLQKKTFPYSKNKEKSFLIIYFPKNTLGKNQIIF